MDRRPKLIVDGYNYIFRIHTLSQKDEEPLRSARDDLINGLSAYQSGKQLEIIVVFDGEPSNILKPAAGRAGVRVLFSREQGAADELILKEIRGATQPGNITLVTSDKQLAAEARAMGCSHWSVEELARKFRRDPTEGKYAGPADPPLSSDEVREWLRLFGET